MKQKPWILLLSFISISIASTWPSSHASAAVADDSGCQAMQDDARTFVKETFETLADGQARVTVTQYLDANCAKPRQAFRTTGTLQNHAHGMADGSRYNVRSVDIATMEVAAWADDVLVAFNGNGQHSPTCDTTLARGQFAEVTKEACLADGFFVRDAAKFLRMPIGNHFLFK